MSYKIYVTPIAQAHIQEAYSYYKNKASISVAKSFKKELGDAYKSLAVNPFYELRTQNFRAIPLKKFPYFIFYEVNENLKEVKIVAIFNTSQSTEKYPK